MRNPEKLATLGTQDTRRRQKKDTKKIQYNTTQHNTTQYVLDTAIHKRTQIT